MIALDPGHGGRHAGVIGPGGLREADVNLAVALALRDLLEEAGARVVMTRAADVEVAGEAAGSLRDELAARAALAREAGADLFVSLHHNSSLPLDRDRRATEVYFRLNDEGPSLDAARSIHRALVRNLGLSPGALSPANYAVLRLAEVPAVLAEASYLSNPAIEARLRTEEAVRREAEAYYLGLARYFARGIPTIEQAPGPDPPLDEPRPAFSFRLADPEGSGIDPSTVVALLDGSECAPPRTQVVFDPGAGTLAVRAARPLASGPHRLEVRARNLAGNAARPLTRAFRIELAARTLEITAEPAEIPRAGPAWLRVAVEARDAWGSPVADGTPVTVRAKGARVPDGAARTREGIAIAHLEVPAAAKRIAISAAVPGRRARPGPDAAPAESVRAALTVARRGGARAGAVVWGRVTSSGDGSPVPGAAVWLAGRPEVMATTDAAGYYDLSLPLPLPLPGDAAPADPPALAVLTSGFGRAEIPLPAPAADTMLARDVSLLPIAGGALRGFRVGLDPADGGDETGGSAPGWAAKDLSLLLARELAVCLGAAGARVTLTREADESVSEADRLRRLERDSAQVVVRLEARAAAGPGPWARVGHYPGSSEGSALADSIAAGLAELASHPVEVAETASFTVRQVSAPAVEVILRAFDAEAEEPLFAGRGEARRLAFAIFRGILEWRAGSGERFGELEIGLGRPDSAAGPGAGPLLLLDGALPLPEAARLTRVTPGEHTLEWWGSGRLQRRGFRVAAGERLLLRLAGEAPSPAAPAPPAPATPAR